MNSKNNSRAKLNNDDITSILIISLLLSLILSIVLFNSYYASKESLGLFGDFYSGVVATLASIIAGIILYRTYINVKKESDFQIINKLYDNIVEDINSLHYRKMLDKDGKVLPKEEQIIFTNIDALHNFDAAHWKNRNSILDHLNSILNSFENIIYMSNKIRYKYDDMKELTQRRIYLLYYSKVLWPVKTKIYGEQFETLLKHHDDSKYILKKYVTMTLDTLNFLGERNLIEKKPPFIAELNSKLELLKSNSYSVAYDNELKPKRV
ncbi:MAG: hypothetical protein JJE25_00045 [Bacteroidia bacterium]|nr:hypothetical protein [Bacteroidia bacterium]